MLLSGLGSIYPGRKLPERSALVALQQQRYGGLIAFWFACFHSLFRLVWTISCKKEKRKKKRESEQIKHLNAEINLNIRDAYTVQ